MKDERFYLLKELQRGIMIKNGPAWIFHHIPY